jgi:poly(3-hydroxybutyrate) depolymerase
MKNKEVVFVLVSTTIAGVMFFTMTGCGDDSSTASAGSGAVSGVGGASNGISGIGGAGGSGTATTAAPVTGSGGRAVTVGQGGKSVGNSGTTAASGGSKAKGGAGGSTAKAGGAGGSKGTAGAGGSDGQTAEKSSGCGKEPPAAPATSVDFNGVARTIIVDVPQGYDKNRAYPLVFSWHGAGVSVDMFRGYLNIPAAVGADGLVVSLETATGSSGQWDYTNDPKFFDALVDKFESEYCIDKHRLFSTGHSMGGMFNHYLACNRANVLRGGAPLAASPQAGMQCVGKLAIWYSQGESDVVGNGPTTRDFWVQNNGCDGSKGTPVSPSPCEGNSYTCTCTDYTVGCAETPVRYCTFPGGHEIPTFIGPGVWSFFKGLK